MKKYFFFIALIVLYAASSYAATIDAVEVQGNRRVPTATILKYTVQPGEEFSLPAVDNSIKNLFSADIVTSVNVDLRVADDRLVLVYIVKEKPYVNKVYFTGNVAVKTHTLEDQITPMAGQLLDSKKVEANQRAIEEKYHDEKYYSVDVKPDIENRGNNSVDVVYSITEGVEAKIRKITIEGNKFFSRKQILKQMETSEKGFWSFLTGSGKLKKSQLKTDIEKVKGMYLKDGFGKVQIGEPRITLSKDKKKIHLTLVIKEGPRYKVGSIKFKGYKHVSLEELRKSVKLKTGDWFNVETYQDDIKAVTNDFTAKGYAYANVNPITTLDDAKKTANVTYDIDENNLVYIDRINIRGNTKTRDRVIRREFDIAEGDVYNSNLITAAKKHLEYDDYFSEVGISEKPAGKDKVDLDVSVKDKPTGMFSIGAGYSSIDQLSGMLSISQKNLFGKGYTITGKGEFSSKRVDYSIAFKNPWLFDKPYSLSMDAFKTKRSYYEYDKKSVGGAIGLGHQFIKRKLFGNIALRYEVVDISSVDDNASYIVKEQEGESTTVSIIPSIKWTTLNHPYNPTKGNQASAYTKLAGSFLGGDNDFVKVGGDFSQYVPLFWKFVFMGHVEAGYIEAYNNKDVPIGERFRLGGMYSVRGYNYGDISPLDSNGERYGGVKYDQLNLEIHFPLLDSIKVMGLFFFDAGQALDKGEQFLNGDMYKSYGGGFRWYSPIGPLRFEYGVPMDGDKKGNGKWEFSIGGII